jgi:hypothetical protein
MQNTQKDDMNVFYDDLMEFALSKMALDETDPLVIAAVLVSFGMSIYKTALVDQDYQLMADSIYEKRNLIKKLEAPTLQ